jgi:N-hydroxyarylamine O-acetyltransferase
VPEGVQRPRTHMLLAVDVAGRRHLVDGGFGGHTLTAPIRLAARAEQATPHGRFRLLHEQHGYVLQAEAADTWRTLYAFDLAEQHAADFEMASWYLCNHPESMFRHTLVAARSRPGIRHALRDNQFSTYGADGRVEMRTLTSGAALRAVLESDFGLRLTGLAGLDAALARIATRPEVQPT